IHLMKDGSLLIGKKTGLFSFRDGVLTEIRPEGLPSFGNVNKIYEDHNGVIWISDRQTITRLSNGRYEQISLSKTPLKGDSFDITEDREGSIWISTIGHGVAQFHDSKFVSLKGKFGINGDGVNAILVTRDGGIWLSTPGEASYFASSNDLQ